MAEPPAGEAQARRHVGRLQVGQLVHDLHVADELGRVLAVGPEDAGVVDAHLRGGEPTDDVSPPFPWPKK